MRKALELIGVVLGSAIFSLIVTLVLSGISSSGVVGVELTHAFFWMAFILAALTAPIASWFIWKSFTSSVISLLATAIVMGGGLWCLDFWLASKKIEQDAANQPPPSPVHKSLPLPQNVPITKTPPSPRPPKPKAGIEQHGTGNNAVEGGIATGPCSNVQIGGQGNTATTNCGPPPLVLDVASVKSGSEGSDFTERPGFLKTEITIVPNQQVTAPFTIALEFDNPISDIGHTVKNVGAQMGGGPFRRGIHARETVLTSIGPEHPLVVVVFSLLPVKLVAAPRVEY